MPKIPVNNFTVIESIYGKFIVNRHCELQADYLIKSGMPHIQPELNDILSIVGALPEGCVVVDAGANIGLVSIPIAQILKERGGTIHAFEVQRMMFNALCGAIALNDLENVFAYHQGLGAKKGTIAIPMADYGVPQDFGQFSLVLPHEKTIRQKKNAPAEEIDIVAIDSLGLPRLDFLKIDVEGMEIDVLAGARRMLKTYRPWCWVEYWLIKTDDIKAQFSDLSYRFFIANERDMLCAPAEKIASTQIAVKAQEV